MRWIFSVAFVLMFAVFSFASPWLGLAFKQEPYKNQIALNVAGVHPSSGALKANIQNGDLIVQINGKKITDMGVVKSELSTAKVGQKVLLEIVRNGKTQKVHVEMTERPDDISSLTGSSIGSKAVAFQKNFYRNGEKRKQKPKVTLLDFWATWCGPCRQTLPIVGRLYEKLSSRGFEVIGVSTEQLSVLEQFYKEHPSPYPLYRDATGEMNRHYGISAIPTLMLLDENGYIQKIWPGVPSEKALEKAIRDAMGK
ncbi:MAG: redoxin domain-containing protein [Fibrobacter sp.]|nr:redoxin domain-containing protein [Fibrobacter sp.]